MGVLGSLTSFVAGAAIGAAGGLIGGRLLAPESGDRTQMSLQNRKNQIAAAGEQARAEHQHKLEQQYRDAVANRAAARKTS
jgi:gas vesicle protein